MLLFYFFVWGLLTPILAQYEPTWESLDSRPLPDWYDKAKIGIFLHWGVYSVPSFGSEWFWFRWQGDSPQDKYVQFMEANYPPTWTYQDFANEFTVEFFKPDEWANLFANSGAKYVVLTSKHHEGYALWPSDYSYSWNAMDVGPRQDLVGELADAIRQTDLHFGLYHSLFEWFHPLYTEDKANNFTTSTFVDTKIFPELQELVTRYEPEIIWSDGSGGAPDTYWRSTEFLAWLYNESPVKDIVLTNDRWGNNTSCSHGGYYTCRDRYNPGVLQPHKWENCMTIDIHSWGYRREAINDDILSIHELLVTVAQTISCGGNILINVGPTKEGTIIPVFQERLLQLGEWLSVNGEAIYESNPWSIQNDTLTPGVWYTAKEPAVYAIVLEWPDNSTLNLGSTNSLFATEETQVTMLGNTESLSWEAGTDMVMIDFPDKASVISQWVWVLKITPSS